MTPTAYLRLLKSALAKSTAFNTFCGTTIPDDGSPVDPDADTAANHIFLYGLDLDEIVHPYCVLEPWDGQETENTGLCGSAGWLHARTSLFFERLDESGLSISASIESLQSDVDDIMAELQLASPKVISTHAIHGEEPSHTGTAIEVPRVGTRIIATAEIG